MRSSTVAPPPKDGKSSIWSIFVRFLAIVARSLKRPAAALYVRQFYQTQPSTKQGFADFPKSARDKELGFSKPSSLRELAHTARLSIVEMEK